MYRTMIKVGRSNNTNLKKILKLIKKTTKYSSRNNTHSRNLLGNDILVSLSGQAKIHHRQSYRELDNQDFIVF